MHFMLAFCTSHEGGAWELYNTEERPSGVQSGHTGASETGVCMVELEEAYERFACVAKVVSVPGGVARWSMDINSIALPFSFVVCASICCCRYFQGTGGSTAQVV